MEQKILGIEGGGTKTDWVYLKQSEKETEVAQKGRLAASNLRLVTDRSLLRSFQSLPGRVTHVGIFLAGCMNARDRDRLQKLAEQLWPGASITTGSDRESSFAAAFADQDGIVVNSGTGASVTGRKAQCIQQAGGRGHLLGDRGGGYVIAIEGLRAALETYDLTHKTTPLAQDFLRALSLNTMDDLVSWIQSADKTSVARLTPVVFEAACQDDKKALAIIKNGAKRLARYSASVARRLGLSAPNVKLMGGVFLHQALYKELFSEALLRLLPRANVEVCDISGAFGAAWLATQNNAEPVTSKESAAQITSTQVELANASTEQANPRSVHMDQMHLSELIDLFVEEEMYVYEALHSCRGTLQRGVELISGCLANGGRLFYIGAGTSGRLGVLDASEIPPTFGEQPERIQGIIAGGAAALHCAVEGAEDDEVQGAMVVSERGIKPTDVVCGISASGRTPFVIAAMKKSKEIGARTILLTCNPARTHVEDFNVEIDLPTGAELITGSTRLKAGTGTKVALNILSTCTMIQLGRVHGNWMVNLSASNEKLRDRAIRLLCQLRGYSYEHAEAVLEQNGWNVRKVLEKHPG